MASGSPFFAAPSGVKVTVKLAPKASSSRISGIDSDGMGGAVLKATVTAAPENGKANAALIKMLAKEWKVPKTSLAVVSGATARRKTLLIKGDTKVLIARLNQWVEEVYG